MPRCLAMESIGQNVNLRFSTYNKHKKFFKSASFSEIFDIVKFK
ncbi:hypothetical protein CLV98_111139 [Dyadobacter jejuensis]|uniref:Uncharacterized protein n=1 Tax=Dyadobacter jejuensis TaxID=1082580 RepID=A0A316AFT2_9BACT|nr:hypothetical protein CLV98_111139 [Dyadobacter jejuensis]